RVQIPHHPGVDGRRFDLFRVDGSSRRPAPRDSRGPNSSRPCAAGDLIHVLPNIVQVVIFWTVQASALLAFAVPFRWAFVALWAGSHFVRAIGLTLAFHRYFAHRAFKMNRVARFVWASIATSAMQKGPLWWAGHHV